VLQIPLNECDYIDLGANHPCHFSNTYYFYQAGARGILVEANPKLANELRFYRHRDIVLNRFVSSKCGQTMDFYVLNGDGLSTADYNVVQEFIKENPWLEVVDTVQVESISVNEIIAHLGHAPKILNIDVEGMEMEILKDIDFETVRPMIIIVEMIPYSKDLYVGARNGDILEFMDKAGYAEFAFTGINSIFIDKERVGEHRT
jgi:FkbM family methyltransferase